MRKINLLVLGALVFSMVSANAFAGVNEYDITKGTSITINATATADSPVFRAREGRIRSIAYQLSSATGTPDVQIDYVVCRTEDGTFHVPDNVTALNASVTDEVEHTKSFTPVVNKYYKIRFTGNAGNPADTVVDLLKLLDVIEQ